MSALTDIVKVLRSPGCQNINFQYKNIKVSGSGFRKIASEILLGHIKIVSSFTVPSNAAKYNFIYNYLVTGIFPEKNLIVHECTHALNDLHKLKILKIDDEASAYIAQCFYMIIANEFSINSFSKTTADRFYKGCINNPGKSSCHKAIFHNGLVIAMDYLTKAKPIDKFIEQLRNAIQHHPLYSRTARNRMNNYDGLINKHIPQAHLNKVHGKIIKPPNLYHNSIFLPKEYLGYKSN
ncbi:MAG: hypothetical protein B6D61_09825 [Bacteroidetes bacterium 4484_249]|nr:MAG: hypothetical protein B6D61_09825 [Bacteroidetes bacterium 4484_249]